MKSDKRRPAAKKKTPRRQRQDTTQILQILGLVLCATTVAFFRPKLAAKYEDLGATTDIYAIPSEDQLIVFSLGYRSAAADLLFGRTMVAAGVHFAEKRPFHHLDAYLKGIIALDPKYLDVYRYADTLLNLSTVEMPKENLDIAREIQERGLKEFPHDPELWMSTGQFVAYLAPNRFTDEEKKKSWRLAGAKILQHACDIWPTRDALPDSCIGSATLYSRAGETGAAISSLERMIAVTDDESIRARATQRLEQLAGERRARKVQESIGYLEPLRQGDLPGVSPTRYQLLSPPFDEIECAGSRGLDGKLECATSFLSRSDILARSRDVKR